MKAKANKGLNGRQLGLRGPTSWGSSEMSEFNKAFVLGFSRPPSYLAID